MSEPPIKRPGSTDGFTSGGKTILAPGLRLSPASLGRPGIRRLRNPERTAAKAQRSEPAPRHVPSKTNEAAGDLADVRGAWDRYRASKDRDSVYIYLSAVFRVGSWWREIGRAKAMCRTALELQRGPRRLRLEPFAVVIFCSSPVGAVDEKTRSKWSRALRVAERFKQEGESFRAFMKRQRGINKAAARFYELAD